MFERRLISSAETFDADCAMAACRALCCPPLPVGHLGGFALAVVLCQILPIGFQRTQQQWMRRGKQLVKNAYALADVVACLLHIACALLSEPQGDMRLAERPRG